MEENFYWQSVNIGNKRRGYVKVDKNNHALEFDNKGRFKVYDSPNGNWFWSEKDSGKISKLPPTEKDLSTPNWSNRQGIQDTKLTNLNNAVAEIFTSTPEDLLRQFQVGQQSSVQKSWYDNDGNLHYELGEKGLKGNDPVGQFIVESTVLGKPIEAILKAYKFRKLFPETKASEEDYISRLKSIVPPEYITSQSMPMENSILSNFFKKLDFTPKTLVKQGSVNKELSQELVNRLERLGINVKDKKIVIDTGTGTSIYNSAREGMQNITNRPIYFGYYGDSKLNTLGEYLPRYNTAIIDVFKGNPANTALHEGVMHGSDDMIEILGGDKLYKDFINKYISTLPTKTLSNGETMHVIGNTLVKKFQNADKWYELRATVGEYIRSIYQKLARSKGYRNFVGHLDELRPEFEALIDKKSKEDLLDELAVFNGYGNNYKNLGNAITDENFIKDLKNIVKTAPVVTAPILLQQK